MTSNCLCILFSESYSSSRNELAADRTLATVPFGGRYRLIDFVLSSLVKASISEIGILTKEHYGSLMDHLGWGKDWDLSRKNGGLRVLTPFAKAETAGIRNRSRIDALISARAFLEQAEEDYVILSDTNQVMLFDFEAMLKFHVERDADITILYHNKNYLDQNGLIVDCDESGRVSDAYYLIGKCDEYQHCALQTFIFNRKLLLNLLDRAYTFNWTDLERDFITKNINRLNIYGFAHNGYAAVINTVADYYRASMDLLDTEIRRELFFSDTPILTRVKNSAPAVYGFESNVHNSLIADGSIIDGELHNCIVFRDVKICKGAVLQNCVIMQNTVVHSGANLNCVITDKDVVISENHAMSGYSTYPFVIAKGQHV